MRRRETPTAGPHIQPELYWGIGPHRFPYCPNNPARWASIHASRIRWAAQARAAGWTPSKLNAAAATDAGYQHWRDTHPARDTAPDPEPAKET
jgi:hypothetical protein